MNWQGKRVLIVGLGKSGLAAVRFLSDRGASVAATDTRTATDLAPQIAALDGMNVELFLVTNDERVFLDRDVIVPSPGVAWDHPHLIAARARGVQTLGELDIAADHLKGHVIGVTGTNGKTTTTALIGHIFETAGLTAVVAGNIGTPLLEIAAASSTQQWNVLELSSFQLEASTVFHCDIAVILNVTPDHLDRHHTFEKYAEAKSQILANQTADDWAVLNSDDAECRKMASGVASQAVLFSTEFGRAKGAAVDSHGITWNGRHVCDFDLPIKGRHNLQNALAAVATTALAGVELDVIARALKSFQPVEHRLEFVRSVAGVDYYNDSKATNVDAALKACEAFDKGLWLILGGRDKDSDYGPLGAALKGRARGVMLIGEAAPIIREHLNGSTPIEESITLERAVGFARSHAEPGDTVVLAPACASFDQFASYAERGLEFKRLVKELED